MSMKDKKQRIDKEPAKCAVPDSKSKTKQQILDEMKGLQTTIESIERRLHEATELLNDQSAECERKKTLYWKTWTSTGNL